MRNTFSEAFVLASTAHPEIYIVFCRLSPAASWRILDPYPIAHQCPSSSYQSITSGICSGLAKGFQPFAYTNRDVLGSIPAFRMGARTISAIRIWPVTVVGMGAGSSIHTLGGDASYA